MVGADAEAEPLLRECLAVRENKLADVQHAVHAGRRIAGPEKARRRPANLMARISIIWSVATWGLPSTSLTLPLGEERPRRLPVP